MGAQKCIPWASLSMVCNKGIVMVAQVAEPAVDPCPGPIIGLVGEYVYEELEVPYAVLTVCVMW